MGGLHRSSLPVSPLFVQPALPLLLCLTPRAKLGLRLADPWDLTASLGRIHEAFLVMEPFDIAFLSDTNMNGCFYEWLYESAWTSGTSQAKPCYGL
jgi:hypothetical protein